MEARHNISGVAARTGFTASALRFYENEGLITPERTDSGYRVYDDRSVERLRFIARAKQLGLSLDEITELVALWEGDECAPVAGRLRDLVEDKIGETQTRISELIAFAGDLQSVHAGLVVGPGDGPCGDDCACHSLDASASVGLPLTTKPTAPTAPAIACTLEPVTLRQRVDHWHTLLARSNGRTVVDGGIVVHLPPDTELAAEAGALAAAEQSCCSFLAFTLRIDNTGTELAVIAPPDARALVDELFGMPA